MTFPSSDDSRLLKSQADMGKLKVRQRKGELVLRESVRKEIFTMVRQMRDKMQIIPDRVSGVLAAETTQSVIHTLITTEIRQACEDLHHADCSSTPSVE